MGVLVLVDPVVGTTTDATLIAANDAAIKAVVNGGIDASNFGAGKIFAPNKIQQAGALTGQAMVWNGTDWAPAATQRKTTAKIVNTTVAATDLLNGEITIPAGAMGATGALRLVVWGDWKQNSGGAAAPPRWQLVLGATTLLDTSTSGAGACGNSAQRYAWALEFLIENAATNSQTCKVTGFLNNNTAVAFGTSGFVVGSGDYNSTFVTTDAVGQLVGVNSGLAIDTTIANLLKLNVINGSASALYETKLFGATAEVF